MAEGDKQNIELKIDEIPASPGYSCLVTGGSRNHCVPNLALAVHRESMDEWMDEVRSILPSLKP